jgi:flagellar protein FliJ
MTFNFRLQRVLELRERHEQAKARDLATAQDSAEQADRTRASLASLRSDSRDQLHAATSGAPRVGHLAQLGTLLASLDERLMLAGDVCREADASVQQARSILEAAARDRRVLDRLKARHAGVWRAGEAHKDRVMMDEVALTQFARKQEEKNIHSAENAG